MPAMMMVIVLLWPQNLVSVRPVVEPVRVEQVVQLEVTAQAVLNRGQAMHRVVMNPAQRRRVEVPLVAQMAGQPPASWMGLIRQASKVWSTPQTLPDFPRVMKS